MPKTLKTPEQPVVAVEGARPNLDKIFSSIDPLSEEPQDFHIIFGGVPIKLNVEKSFLDDASLVREIGISAAREDNSQDVGGIFIKVIETIHGVDSQYRAETRVKNQDRNLKGFGRALWEAALCLIQKIADQKGLPVRHRVSAEPDPSLSYAKWDKLFVPLLEKHGYRFVGGTARIWAIWEKEYKPEARERTH